MYLFQSFPDYEAHKSSSFHHCSIKNPYQNFLRNLQLFCNQRNLKHTKRKLKNYNYLLIKNYRNHKHAAAYHHNV